MTSTGTPRHRLYVMGRRELVGPRGHRVSSVLAQPKRLCLLTYLAMAPGPVSRAKLAALFWPESDETRARNALSQAVFYLRKSLGKRTIESVEGDQLGVPPERLWCDARAFLAGELATPEAAAAARGDVLDGWNADDSQPLQEWLDTLRRQVRALGAELEETVGASGRASTPDVAAAESSHGGGGGRDDTPSRALQATAPETGDANTVDAGGQRVSARHRVAIRGRWATLFASAVALLLAVVVARWATADPGGTETAGAGSLAPDGTWAAVVLLEPVLTGAEPLPTRMNDAIRVRIAAELAAIPGLVSSTSLARSATEARRELQAIGEPTEGKWFLTVLTTIDGHAADLTVLLGDGSRNYPPEYERLDFEDRQTLAVEGPRRIALHVVETVEARLPGLARR